MKYIYNVLDYLELVYFSVLFIIILLCINNFKVYFRWYLNLTLFHLLDKHLCVYSVILLSIKNEHFFICHYEYSISYNDWYFYVDKLLNGSELVYLTIPISYIFCAMFSVCFQQVQMKGFKVAFLDT